MPLPPGFDAMNLPLPRATKEALASLRSIFSQLPFSKGGKSGIFHKFSKKLSSLWKREDGRDFCEGFFKTRRCYFISRTG
jgi:hypothetical protein